MAATDSEPLFRNNEKTRWGGGSFKINEQKASSSTEQRKHEPENLSSNGEGEVVKPLANFPIISLKHNDDAKKTMHYIQVNHVTEKPKMKNDEAEAKLKQTEFNFMIELKNPTHKTSVDPTLLQLK